MHTADNDNHDAISHDDKYAAFLKDLAKRHPPKAPNFRHVYPADVGLGIVLYGTDPNTYRPTDRKLFKDSDGVWDSKKVEREIRVGPGRPHNYVATSKETRAATEKTLAKLRRQIAKRQKIGDDYTPVRGADEFPIITALRRDGNLDLVDVVTNYRRLVALSNASPLRGNDYGYTAEEGIHIAHRAELDTEHKDIEEAAEAGWTRDSLTGGEIKYKGTRKRKGGTWSYPATRVKPVENKYTGMPNDQSVESMVVHWSEDTLIKQIDAKRLLASLRSALGALVTPFEAAVLDCDSLSTIGKAEGFEYKPEIAGRALVVRGLNAVRFAWGDQTALRELAEAAADGVVEDKRAEIAAGKARFLNAANNNNEAKIEAA